MSTDDLSPTRDTPTIAADFVGVKVALSPASAVRGPVALVGVFQFSAAQADAIDQCPHRALVVALASTNGTMVTTPFRQRIFFPDDVQRVASLVRGYFRIDLVNPGDVVPEGPFWLSASMGEHLSNVVAFCGPPGA
jgi:hypothetical protein